MISWPNPNDIASQTTFAFMVGVSQQAISKLKEKNVLADGGTYDNWLNSYVERLRSEAAGREQDTRLSASRIRETEASANLKELDYLDRLKTVIWRPDIEPLLTELCSAIQFNVMAAQERIIESIESKYSIKLEDEDIGKHLRSALESVASGAGELVSRIAEGVDGDEAAALDTDAAVESIVP